MRIDTPQPIQIEAPSILNIGGIGTGKSHALSTLAEAGLEVFVIITEPTGLETLLDVWQEKKLPIDKLHWKTIVPSRAGFDGLLQLAKTVSIADQKFLSDQKPSGDRKNAQFIHLLGTCNDFICERDGKSYGPISAFSPDRALAVDSLSGINLMAMDLVIGDKATANPGEWGIAMKMIEKLLLNLTSNLKCTLAITAHMERETEEVTGANQIMVSTLGKKLAPTIPRFFSEVVMSFREGEKFYWSTSALNVNLKNRALPVSAKLDASYVPIVKRYRERLAFAASALSTVEAKAS